MTSPFKRVTDFTHHVKQRKKLNMGRKEGGVKGEISFKVKITVSRLKCALLKAFKCIENVSNRIRFYHIYCLKRVNLFYPTRVTEGEGVPPS